MMRSLLQKKVLALILMASACGAPYSNDDILFRLAIPSADTLELSVESVQTQQALRKAQDMCPAETALSYLRLRETARAINGSLFSVLSIVDVVMRYPPSEREEDFRRWGPWEDKEKAYQLNVYRTRSSTVAQFRYEMQGRRIDADEWLVLLAGDLLEGDSAANGRGTLMFDFDAMSQIDPSSKEENSFSVDYDTQDSGLSFLLTVKSSSISLMSWATAEIRKEHFGDDDTLLRYLFFEDAGGAGRFQIEGPTDVHKDSDPNLAQEEFMTISGRWLSDQSGRAETTIESGDVQSRLRVSECWDKDLVLNFREGQYDFLTTTCGVVENCPAPFQNPEFLR